MCREQRNWRHSRQLQPACRLAQMCLGTGPASPLKPLERALWAHQARPLSTSSLHGRTDLQSGLCWLGRQGTVYRVYNVLWLI